MFNLYEWIEEHVAFQMTPRLLDQVNCTTFYAQIYEALAARDKDRYNADVAIIQQKLDAVGNGLALHFAAISLTNSNMDMKLI